MGVLHEFNPDFREIAYIRSVTPLRGILCTGKSVRHSRGCGIRLLLSSSHLEGCLTRPLGVSPVPGRINGVVSSNALSGPCLLTSVELFSMLPLDRKDMRNGNSPSDPRGKPAFLASHQAVSQRLVGEMPAKAIMHGTFQAIWPRQVVRGSIPNYKAGLEPPGELPASATNCWLCVKAALLCQ